MHLVSGYRYPIMHMISVDTIIEYLISAPKVVRELPMYWTFLDGLQDGTTMLTWQPLNHLGTNFASDGYVWADAEQAFTFEAKGYVCASWNKDPLPSSLVADPELDGRGLGSPERLPSSK
jgi:hypothetical protein